MPQKPVTKPRGRPPKPGGPTPTPTFSLRLSADLRRALEREADQSGRSLSREIERRLRWSFEPERVRPIEVDFPKIFGGKDADDEAGGEKNAALALLLRELIERAEFNTGRSWHEDAYTADQVAKAFRLLILDLAPRAPLEPRKGAADFCFEWPEALSGACHMSVAHAVIQAPTENLLDSYDPQTGQGAIYRRQEKRMPRIKRFLGPLADRLTKAIAPGGVS